MNEHAAAALLGLDRVESPDNWPPGLFRPPKDSTDAKALLLAAGAWAIAEKAAGELPIVAPVPPVPLETAAACPPELARLFRVAWGESPADIRSLDREFRKSIEGQLEEPWSAIVRRLLPELLDQLAGAGAVLPPECAAFALAVPKAWRATIGPLLGTRGRWLAELQGLAEHFPASPVKALSAAARPKGPAIHPAGPLATLDAALHSATPPWDAARLDSVLRDLLPIGLPPGNFYVADVLAWGAARLPAVHVAAAWDRLPLAAGLTGGKMVLGRGWTVFAAVLYCRQSMVQ